MREGNIIAHAKRDFDLFLLDLAVSGAAMSVRNLKPKAMAISGRGRPTHLVSTNKRIRVWYGRLAYTSNARVVRTSKLTDGIELNTSNNEYNPIKVRIDFDDSDASDSDSKDAGSVIQHLAQTIASCKENDLDNLDKLCTLCVDSKSTRVVRQNKSMTVTTEKLEEVHADLWRPHDSPSRYGSIYSAILMCEHTRKTWTLYLRSKDEFFDAFQAWLPKVEAESNCLMKALRADGGREFVFIKLRNFCEKRGIIIKYTAPYVHEENGLAERGWRTIVTVKDAMLIDSGLPNNFWVEAMEIANYLHNRLLTRSRSHGKLVPEEAWTNRRRNLSHIRIFGSLVLANISDEKRSKSDNQKTWQSILIGYNSDTTKHFQVWASPTKQVIIVSESFINESEQGAKLLIQWPLEPSSTKRKALPGEPKPRGRSRKIRAVEPVEPAMTKATVAPPASKKGPAEPSPITQEHAMSITEASSKIHEPKTYEDAINDPIHGRR